MEINGRQFIDGFTDNAGSATREVVEQKPCRSTTRRSCQHRNIVASKGRSNHRERSSRDRGNPRRQPIDTIDEIHHIHQRHNQHNCDHRPRSKRDVQRRQQGWIDDSHRKYQLVHARSFPSQRSKHRR